MLCNKNRTYVVCNTAHRIHAQVILGLTFESLTAYTYVVPQR